MTVFLFFSLPEKIPLLCNGDGTNPSHTIDKYGTINTVKNGDVIVISRMDGIDPMIMVGSGGRVGHCCVCTWMDGELYVIEAQDAPYWPKAGIQRTKWDEWIKWAHNADFNVLLLPLREEYRNKLDVEKATIIILLKYLV